MARSLVTGATGFLGGALARRLCALGHEVTGVGRDEAAGRVLAGDGITFVRADVADERAIAAAVRGHELVFHCAGLSSPWGSANDFHRANVLGTRVMAAASQTERVRRFVHVSSPSIFVDFRDRLDLREDAPVPRPINHYARTKRLAEEEIARAVAAGLPAVVIRPQGIIGPGDRVIFPRLVRVARRGVFPVIGDGHARMNLTYIDNVVDAMLACVAAPEHVVGRIYHIANREPVRIYEMLDRVLSALGVRCRQRRIPFAAAYALAGALEALHRTVLRGREPILTRYAVCVLARSRTLNIEAAQRDLGWTPKVDIDDGLDRFISWWKENERG